MAWSTPPTFTAGNVVTEAQMDIVSDDLTFLGGPPRCRVYNSAAISHTTSGTFQTVTFDSERFDTDTMHSTAVNTGRITFTTAGMYLVAGHLSFATSALGIRAIRIRANGATPIADDIRPAVTGDSTRFSISAIYAFTAGQYVELQGYQSSGAALNMEAAAAVTPEFSAVLLAVS